VKQNTVRAIEHAVRYRLPTTSAWIRSLLKLYRVCGGRSRSKVGFLRVLRIPLPILIPPTAPYSVIILYTANKKKKQTPWSESASEPYRLSDRRLSAKLVPTFSDRGCHVVGVTVPYGRILGFLDRCRYSSFK
jgi:hypothetical protein